MTAEALRLRPALMLRWRRMRQCERKCDGPRCDGPGSGRPGSGWRRAADGAGRFRLGPRARARQDQAARSDRQDRLDLAGRPLARHVVPARLAPGRRHEPLLSRAGRHHAAGRRLGGGGAALTPVLAATSIENYREAIETRAMAAASPQLRACSKPALRRRRWARGKKAAEAPRSAPRLRAVSFAEEARAAAQADAMRRQQAVGGRIAASTSEISTLCSRPAGNAEASVPRRLTSHSAPR